MPAGLTDLVHEFNAATIRVDAAVFLGTLYPIGILAGLVEVRAITRSPRVRLKLGLYSRPSAGWIALSTLPAFSSLWFFADAVIKHTDIRGGSAVYVVAAGTILFASLGAGVVELVWVAFKEDAKGIDTVGPTHTGKDASPPKSSSKQPPQRKQPGSHKRRNRNRGR